MKPAFRLIALLLPVFLSAQSAQKLPPGAAWIGLEIVDGEQITSIRLKPIFKYARPARQRQHDRLVRNVKKVYPIALDAERIFDEMEAELAKIPRAGARREYVAKMERQVQKKYTPVLKNMTFSQGKILIKLIDRQTSHTSYDILLEMRGRFRASIWQGVAKLFNADLNAAYDADDEDREIEEIIELIESGQL